MRLKSRRRGILMPSFAILYEVNSAQGSVRIYSSPITTHGTIRSNFVLVREATSTIWNPATSTSNRDSKMTGLRAARSWVRMPANLRKFCGLQIVRTGTGAHTGPHSRGNAIHLLWQNLGYTNPWWLEISEDHHSQSTEIFRKRTQPWGEANGESCWSVNCI